MDGWKRWLGLRPERALYTALPTDEWEQDTVNIDKAKLQCPICTHPLNLKPPIFQCVNGHLACGACHGHFPHKDRCYTCAHPGGYSRNFPLEDVIRSTSAKIYCPECRYYTSNDHQANCPHAPCRCSEPGCAFVGSPAWFIYHLRATHSWPVNTIDYGKAYQLQLPASKPRWCLLVGKEDMRVFVVFVAALHGSVSLMCLTANAAAGPRYTCKMSTTVSVDMEVLSSAVAWEAAATKTDSELEAALVVQSKMLDGPSMELHLSVIIDKVQT